MIAYNLIKNKQRLTLFGLLGVLLIVTACSDITDTERKYLDQGETNYVGKMDSLVVHGGNGRVLIVAKNTYLRTATKCFVKWINIEGEVKEKAYVIKDFLAGDSTCMPVDSLPEGDYDFYVYTMDDHGNKSLTVECTGSSYGEKYAATQPRIAINSITVNDDTMAEFSLSSSKMAVKYKVFYSDGNGGEKFFEVKGNGGRVVVPNWVNQNTIQFKVVTYVLPSDKYGVDTLVLPQLVQTAKQIVTQYDLDKTKIQPMTLTKNDDTGKNGSGQGIAALFDDLPTECWGQNISAPGHFCFDLGTNAYISGASIIGRLDYPGWDVVKFEIWGRESIADGAYGTTGYYIMSGSRTTTFESEAIRRQWKKVGDGWFKYTSPRSNPQTSQCVLTNVDHSFKPRYILFRVMSVLTPDIVPVPADKYFGDDGGYYSGDGVNSNNRAFCIRELNLKASGVAYAIQ